MESGYLDAGRAAQNQALGSSTSAAAIVHVTIRFTGPASGVSVVDRSDFDAPPLGLGTFTQQALESD
jgi:hypothetical protein